MFNFSDSLLSLLQNCSNISIEPFSVQINNKENIFTPPKNLYISPLIFRNFDCKMCGLCCRKIKCNHIYPKIDLNIDNLKLTTIRINDKEKELYSFDSLNGCQFQEGNLCNIHEHNPLMCSFVPLKFKRIKDKCYLTKEHRGRNWRFGCPAILNNELKLRNFTDINKENLIRLQNICNYFEIKTYNIEKIIRLLSTTFFTKHIRWEIENDNI